MRKPTIWVPTRSDTSQPVQSQKVVLGWKFWIYKVEELFYPCFAYADCRFSHAAAHLISTQNFTARPQRLKLAVGFLRDENRRKFSKENNKWLSEKHNNTIGC